MRFLVKKEKEKISRKFDLCIVSFIVSSTSLIAISFVIYKKKTKSQLIYKNILTYSIYIQRSLLEMNRFPSEFFPEYRYLHFPNAPGT